MIKNVYAGDDQAYLMQFEKWIDNLICQAQRRMPKARILYYKIGNMKAIIPGRFGGFGKMMLFNDIISKVG